jgi:hypothetical protein
MRDNDLTYDDFIHRINIQDVLQDAGYQLNRRDGLRYPSYIRLDNEGKRVRGDKFIVTANGMGCFQPPRQKVFNVISFIKEHPEKFADYQTGMDKDRLVNLVCNRLLNNPIISNRGAKPMSETKAAKPFALSDYDIHRFNTQDRASQRKFYPYFKHRGIDLYTQYAFNKHFVLATKHRTDGLSFANLSFPLVKPNDDKVIGFEERGRPRLDGTGAYKGKAEGSNASEGLWIANLTGKPLSQAKEILWFESAYDAMAEYQLNPAKTVFVSTGGTPTEKQMRGMLAATPNARHYLGFDKDTAGRQFADNFKAIAKEIGFRQENVQSYHPLGIYKDWNDALLNKKLPSLMEQGISDNFDYGEFVTAQRAEREAERQQREAEKQEGIKFKR